MPLFLRQKGGGLWVGFYFHNILSIKLLTFDRCSFTSSKLGFGLRVTLALEAKYTGFARGL